MYKNNFDQSSTGTNIEVRVCYDSDLARMNFEESIEILQFNGYRTNTIAYYTDCGNVESSKHISFELQGDNDSIVKFIKSECSIYEAAEVDEWNEAEKQESVFDNYGERITLLNYEDFNKVYAEYGLSVKPSKELIKIVTRGYSQGDYAEVFYCPDDIAGAWGKEPTQAEIQETIDRLFWDQPIYGRVTIDGTEYNYDETAKDCFKWEPSEFAEYIAKESGVPVETIAAMLPSEVPYE